MNRKRNRTDAAEAEPRTQKRRRKNPGYEWARWSQHYPDEMKYVYQIAKPTLRLFYKDCVSTCTHPSWSRERIRYEIMKSYDTQIQKGRTRNPSIFSHYVRKDSSKRNKWRAEATRRYAQSLQRMVRSNNELFVRCEDKLFAATVMSGGTPHNISLHLPALRQEITFQRIPYGFVGGPDGTFDIDVAATYTARSLKNLLVLDLISIIVAYLPMYNPLTEFEHCIEVFDTKKPRYRRPVKKSVPPVVPKLRPPLRRRAHWGMITP